jgi:hypothetical protein
MRRETKIVSGRDDEPEFYRSEVTVIHDTAYEVDGYPPGSCQVMLMQYGELTSAVLTPAQINKLVGALLNADATVD